MENTTSVPGDVLLEIEKTKSICLDFIRGVFFIINDSRRDQNFSASNLLHYVSDDLLESVVSIKMMTQEGVHNPCCRELRYILEASMKLCYVQQKRSDRSVLENINYYRTDLDAASISIKKDIDLYFLPQEEFKNFSNEVGRLYGETSSYVHLTVQQLQRRLNLIEEGVAPGLERAIDVKLLNDLVFRALACSLVYIAHAAPTYVLGDWLVERDGSSLNWEFSKSKYIAYIDEYFDYKFERQKKLQEIKTNRWNLVAYH